MTDGDNTNGMNGDITKSSLSHKQKMDWQTSRWKNRRRMAWFSIYTLIAVILLFFFAPISDARLKIIAEPIAMMGFVFGGVVAAYMGFTTFEKTKMGK